MRHPAPAPVLAGSVVGHDGKPLVMAHVHVGGRVHAVAGDGSFRIPVSEGPARVMFTGVDHAEQSVLLLEPRGVVLAVQRGNRSQSIQATLSDAVRLNNDQVKIMESLGGPLSRTRH